MNGHNVTCNKPYTDEQAGRFQGRMWPETLPESERAATKHEELEINVTMIQLKLFLDKTETILSQARGLNIPLHDCVVLFDLRKCPPTVAVKAVKNHTECCDSPEQVKCFENTRSKENITCVYISWIYYGYMDEDGGHPGLAMQKFFPHEWLSTKKTQK